MQTAERRVPGALTCFAILAAVAGIVAGWNVYSALWPEPVTGKADATASAQVLAANTAAKADRLRPAWLASDEGRAALPDELLRPNTSAGHTSAAASRQPDNARGPVRPRQRGLLDDAQIANIKARLRLTPAQEQYWPAVEAALRDFINQQLRESRKPGAEMALIDVQSREVQRLTRAAMPLLMRLREDQKREVRILARVIGLESVVSQF